MMYLENIQGKKKSKVMARELQTDHGRTESVIIMHIFPVGIWWQNDVASTSMRRNHFASTLIRRHFASNARGVEAEHHCFRLTTKERNYLRHVIAVTSGDSIKIINMRKVLSIIIE